MSESAWRGAFLKIERAKKHLEELHRCLSDYADSDPAEAIPEFKPERDEWVVSLKVHKRPPKELPLIVGDAVHNLRCALDYMAWELVLANGREPNERLQFPLRTEKSTNLSGLRNSGDVDKGALAIIEAAQPYNGGGRHPLGVLQALSNADKHRGLRPVLWQVKGLRLSMKGSEADVPGAVIWTGAFEDGAELASYPARYHGQVDVHLYDSVTVTLVEIAVEPRRIEEGAVSPPMVDDLFGMALFIAELCGGLLPYFR